MSDVLLYRSDEFGDLVERLVVLLSEPLSGVKDSEGGPELLELLLEQGGWADLGLESGEVRFERLEHPAGYCSDPGCFTVIDNLNLQFDDNYNTLRDGREVAGRGEDQVAGEAGPGEGGLVEPCVGGVGRPESESRWGGGQG